MVFKYISRSVIKVSQVIPRDNGVRNESLWGLPDVVIPLEPTPLSTLVALAVCSGSMSPDDFPRTSDLTPEDLANEDREYKPLQTNPSTRSNAPSYPVGAQLSSTPFALRSATGRVSRHSTGNSLPFQSHPSDSKATYPLHYSAYPTSFDPALPVSLDRYEGYTSSADHSHPIQKLELSIESLKPGAELRALASMGLGVVSREKWKGRLWTVYGGTLNVAVRPTAIIDPTPAESLCPPPSPLISQISPSLHALPTDSHDTSSESTNSEKLSQSSRSSSGSDANLGSTPRTSLDDSPARECIDVVFKVARMSEFRDLPLDQLDHGEYSPSMAKLAIINEAKLFCGLLQSFQGDVIPRFYGLFHWPATDIWVMVLERVGHPICSHGGLKNILTEHK